MGSAPLLPSRRVQSELASRSPVPGSQGSPRGIAEDRPPRPAPPFWSAPRELESICLHQLGRPQGGLGPCERIAQQGLHSATGPGLAPVSSSSWTMPLSTVSLHDLLGNATILACLLVTTPTCLHFQALHRFTFSIWMCQLIGRRQRKARKVRRYLLPPFRPSRLVISEEVSPRVFGGDATPTGTTDRQLEFFVVENVLFHDAVRCPSRSNVRSRRCE